MQLSTAKLKQIRNSKGWSQHVLATATGLSLRTIQRIETQGKASAESTLAIASAFEVTPTELRDDGKSIDVNWTRSRVMFAVLMLGVLIATFVSLFYLVADISSYLDLPTIMFTLSLTYMLTALSFGIEGVKRAVVGVKYLFAAEVIGGKAATNLANIFTAQIRYIYSSALILSLIGIVAIIGNTANSTDTTQLLSSLELSIPVVVLPFLYAVIVSEVVFRPIKIKLQCWDHSFD